MKKTYIAPRTKELQLETSDMLLAGSVGMYDTPVGKEDALSRDNIGGWDREDDDEDAFYYK